MRHSIRRTRRSRGIGSKDSEPGSPIAASRVPGLRAPVRSPTQVRTSQVRCSFKRGEVCLKRVLLFLALDLEMVLGILLATEQPPNPGTDINDDVSPGLLAPHARSPGDNRAALPGIVLQRLRQPRASHTALATQHACNSNPQHSRHRSASDTTQSGQNGAKGCSRKHSHLRVEHDKGAHHRVEPLFVALEAPGAASVPNMHHRWRREVEDDLLALDLVDFAL
eukprot:1535984-Rhodomonas_salina.3